MTRSLALGCALAVTLFSSLAWSQSRPLATAPVQPPAASTAGGGMRVGLIDLGHILRNHPGYAARREALKERAKSMTNQETALRKQLQTESEKLRDYQPGSLEFKGLEAKLIQQQSDFQLQAKLSRRELAEEEAKMLYETYTEVQAIIDRLAESYQISLVIRFERDRMDPSDPDSISRGLMNPVVYHRGLDITDDVLRQIKPVAARATLPGQGLPATRPLR